MHGGDKKCTLECCSLPPSSTFTQPPFPFFCSRVIIVNPCTSARSLAIPRAKTFCTQSQSYSTQTRILKQSWILRQVRIQFPDRKTSVPLLGLFTSLCPVSLDSHPSDAWLHPLGRLRIVIKNGFVLLPFCLSILKSGCLDKVCLREIKRKKLTGREMCLIEIQDNQDKWKIL